MKKTTKRSTKALSDAPESEQQLEATKNLYQLFHNNLRSILTNGGYSSGFQLLQNAIDLTDIRATIPGWESMPIAIINQRSVQDYDSMSVLSQELMQSSQPGPFRVTDGKKWNEEYEEFLAGVQGVTSVQIPNPDNTESAKRAVEFEHALNNCTGKYTVASMVIIAKYSEEQFSNIFCPEVRQREQAMFAQIGIEAGSVSNNKPYAAAVALGMARGLFTMTNAFKKYQSFRAMEYECLKAQEEERPMNGNAKSISFNYNHHNWRNTQESSSFSVSAGYGLFTANVGHTKETITGLDLTAIGGIEIALADFKYVPLYPGEWYSSTILNSLRYEMREATSSPVSRFFGASGSLTLMPKALFVVNNPVISFFVKSDKAETFSEKTSTTIGAGLNIFGFNFGGNYAKGKQVDEGTQTGGNTKITITSNSCRPQLFAVDNHYIY